MSGCYNRCVGPPPFLAIKYQYLTSGDDLYLDPPLFMLFVFACFVFVLCFV